jgi:Cu-Zn family superoxide dismutase
MVKNLLGAAAGACLLVPVALAQEPQTVSVPFVGLQGQDVGQAALTQTPHGVLIRLGVTNLPPGPHAVHVHETGVCDPSTGFESAGDHYAPGGREHGFAVEGGPHAGDMPNQWASSEGHLRGDIINPRVTLGEGDGTLFDEDGSAIVVHSSLDDYRSQPSGEAGDRIACAVIRR